MAKEKLIKAKEGHQVLAFSLALGILALGLFGVGLLPPLLERLAESASYNPASALNQTQIILSVLIVLSTVLPAVFGLLLIHLGVRVLRAKQYPYPGMTLVFDSTSYSGAAAQRRGWIAIGAGAVALACAPMVGWYLFRLANRLLVLMV